MAFTGRGTDVFGETSGDNYKLYCTQCHGLKGNGAGINKADMSVAPRNHTDTVEMSRLGDGGLSERAVPLQGRVGTSPSRTPPPAAILISLRADKGCCFFWVLNISGC